MRRFGFLRQTVFAHPRLRVACRIPRGYGGAELEANPLAVAKDRRPHFWGGSSIAIETRWHIPLGSLGNDAHFGRIRRVVTLRRKNEGET